MKKFFIMLSLSVALMAIGTTVALAAGSEDTAAKTESASGTLASVGMGQSNLGKFIGAGIAICGGCIGAGLGVGRIGSAAMGAISEKPELLGISLVFVAMAEGLSIIGFVVSFLILGSK
jgi:V/A-type H+/Na+-transporting ATPase subunit K